MFINGLPSAKYKTLIYLSFLLRPWEVFNDIVWCRLSIILKIKSLKCTFWLSFYKTTYISYVPALILVWTINRPTLIYKLTDFIFLKSHRWNFLPHIEDVERHFDVRLDWSLISNSLGQNWEVIGNFVWIFKTVWGLGHYKI